MDEIRGFPPTVGVGCRYRSWLKVDSLEAAAGVDNDIYIGIAADEAGRSRALEYAKGKNRYHFPSLIGGDRAGLPGLSSGAGDVQSALRLL